MSERLTRVTRRARWPAAGALVAVAIGVAVLVSADGRPASRSGRAFSWLRATPAPAGWATARTPSGAALAYPPGWRRIHADAGELSAAPAVEQGSFVGYLNATPQQGAETLANWRRFRVAHNADEGARRVVLEAAASALRFRSGRASCVIDAYSTSRARFREIACFVAGTHATTVIVGAAPVSGWSRQAPVLEQAIAAFAT